MTDARKPSAPTILVGRVAPLAGTSTMSGIDKHPVSEPCTVTREGFASDAQADRKNHGGPEKAVNHYPVDHYAPWREAIGPHPLLCPGGFGENISCGGLTESDVHIGDVFRLGTVTLQISQGRQPCWKLNLRFARKTMAREVQESGRTGWYYRVLEPGHVTPGDSLDLVERPLPDWPLSRVTALLYKQVEDAAAYAALAELPYLAENWRVIFAKRLATRAIEDWGARLDGAAG